MKRHLRVAGVLAALASTALLNAQSAQPGSQLPTFKSEVEYVDVDVIVTDQQGRFVRGLAPEDFQVFEDGRRQTITNFSLIDIPVERADRPLFQTTPIERDVESNEHPFDGRIYIVVLDDLHTDAMRSLQVKRAARQFIERFMGANDLMAVVHTGGRVDAAQEFTGNKRLLLDAVDRFIGRKLPSPTIARTQEFFRMQFGGAAGAVADPYDQERAYNARASMNMLRDVSQWLTSIRGRRKTLLFISEGIDYDVTDIIRDPAAVQSSASVVLEDIREAVLATARANVSLYAVDPRGLTSLGDESITVGGFPDHQPAAGPGADGAPTGPSGAGIGTSSLRNDLWLAQQNLHTLSEQSGGFAVVNANQFDRAFERIVADNSSYYVLAYYPPSVKRDGKFHRIEVRVSKPGLSVRARRGYSAPKGEPRRLEDTTKTGVSRPVLEALNSPMPVSGVKMKVFAAPFKGDGNKASVLVGVELNGSELSLANSGRIEVSYIAVDAKGKITDAKTDTLSLNLRPETRARIQQTGLRSLARLSLPAGRYQLRVGSLDPGGAVGSVITYLEVLDYAKVPFSMSGLLLTSMAGSGTLTTRPDDQLKGLLPAAPVALRAFPRNDEIALFAEVYDNQGDLPHRVDLSAKVTSDAGATVFTHEEVRESSELNGKSGGYGFAVRIPVADLPLGRNVLTVEARSRLANQPSVSRQVEFTVIAPVSPPR